MPGQLTRKQREALEKAFVPDPISLRLDQQPQANTAAPSFWTRASYSTRSAPSDFLSFRRGTGPSRLSFPLGENIKIWRQMRKLRALLDSLWDDHWDIMTLFFNTENYAVWVCTAMR